jgi:hypothetical protein
MALIPQITSVSIKHGKTARATELAIVSKTSIKGITPKTITKR